MFRPTLLVAFPLNSQWDDEPPSLATFMKGVKRLLDEGGGNEEEEAPLMKGRVKIAELLLGCPEWFRQGAVYTSTN